MTVISSNKASFSYGATPVFKDVTVTIPPKGIFCLLGPNGCGKTTFIDAILGSHKLTAGDIRLNNNTIQSMSPRKIARQIAYVPQKHRRHFSFSVMDILIMGRTAHTSFFNAPNVQDKKLAQDILDAFNMTHLKDRDYTKLSGGEMQMVMIMRALVQDTPIIVMDEPTAHLDFKHELLVLETIAHLVQKRNKTVIMATHFPNHAFYFENKGLPVTVAFMHQKTIHTPGIPSEILTRENIDTFYNVTARVVSHILPGKGSIKQIIPVETKKEHP